MLTTLHIENIAVIERADIDFACGFNVLTGETGAGKSIVIDALDAVLGGRTSRDLVRSGAEKALVSAVFSSDGAESWCRENDLESEEELILQRRINRDGKSSCRVNGVPVSVSQLRELGSMLLDIHGQNDGRQLMDEARHRIYLDDFGVEQSSISDYVQAYRAFRETQKEIARLNIDEAEKERLTETLAYQIEELENANLREGEETELEERRELLKNSGKLTEAAEGAYAAIYGADSSALSTMGEAGFLLSRASAWSEELAQIEKCVMDAKYVLEDAAERLRDFRDTLSFSPEEYDRLETRLAQIRKLKKKYGKDEGELIEFISECRNKLDDIEYADDRIKKLESELESRNEAVAESSARLTAARIAAGEKLERRIIAELRELNMPSITFEVEITPKKPDATGGDEIRFLMSANAGEKPGRIAKIASGGELSRIMLAMKSVFAENDRVQSLVFDEIDTGVSGVAAQRVGEKMAQLARDKQVLCVTHLPQIAALADSHFSIEKEETDGRTFTSITELDEVGRTRELARLYGGDNITEKTLSSAAEQLSAANKFKERLLRT